MSAGRLRSGGGVRRLVSFNSTRSRSNRGGMSAGVGVSVGLSVATLMGRASRLRSRLVSGLLSWLAAGSACLRLGSLGSRVASGVGVNGSGIKAASLGSSADFVAVPLPDLVLEGTVEAVLEKAEPLFVLAVAFVSGVLDGISCDN